MKAKDNQFYGKGIFEDIMEPKLLDNQMIIPITGSSQVSHLIHKVGKHISIESWEEYKWFDHIKHTPTGVRYDVFIDGQIRNSGGKTYLVTEINNDNS